ncbi:MAG: sodium:proton antiporter [Deltaproteobacteria bacterium]|nr:MAG: sodium:proton antiporter [Deltaproteobacteria bacterium]
MAISLAVIIVLGLGADYIFRKMKIPGLVGMLLVGILSGPYVFGFMRPEMMHVSGDFRKIALIVILLRAGFELHRDTLNRVGKAALTMSVIPAIFEIVGVTLVAPYFLHMTYLEAAILGTILGAVSPAVVVPLMINFMDRGRGSKKGIPTLILGASSVDDVFVIVIFSILMGMYGGEKVNILLKLTEIPVSITLGIIVGTIPGMILYWLFKKYDWIPPKRTMLVMGVAIFLTWIEEAVKPIPVASLLGVMAIGFIILEKSEPIAHIISQKLKKLWVFAELLLFVLVGAQVNIHVALKAGLAGTAVILTGLIFRSVGTYLSLLGTPYTFKERMYCVVAYIPKATVQAAIGAVPLAAGVASGDVILAVAVLSILITAPIGAFGIMFFGERILDHGEKSSFRFRELRDKLGLPHVGERIRDKDLDIVYKVIEEKEEWLNDPTAADKPGEKNPVPSILVRLWQEDTGAGLGKGKTKTVRYSGKGESFNDHFEIVYDW